MAINEFSIKNITLKNFRGFENRTFVLNDRFTVFIGDNGKGKTSIIEGLCVALGGWVRGFVEGAKDYRNIYKSDVRTIKPTITTKGAIPQYPVEVVCSAQINDDTVEWSRELDKNGHTKTGGLSNVSIITKKLNKKISSANDMDVILPIIGYYSCLRSLKGRAASTEFEAASRTEGYVGSLLLETKYHKMYTFIKELKYEHLEEPGNTPIYDVMMEALTAIIENVAGDGSKVDYVTKYGELMLKGVNGELTPFSELSDGYKNMLAMVADIVYRMAVLNPQLKQNLLKETPGVILIDEIDLHLHPKWQRQVVGDLKKIFPEVQFIATTHSPFIVQSLEEGELVVLDQINDIDEYSGASIEDISEEVMGVEMPQYSIHKLEMYKSAHNYFSKLESMDKYDEAKLEDLKMELDILAKRYGENVAYYAFIEQKYYAKKAKLEAGR